MNPLSFNEICAIAASIEELNRDLDSPIYVEGDIWMGDEDEYVEMQDGEAARCVVIKALEHPYVQRTFDENEKMWQAIKWAVKEGDIPEPPEEFRHIFDYAVMSLVLSGELDVD